MLKVNAWFKTLLINALSPIHKLRLTAREGVTSLPSSPQNHNFYAMLDKLRTGALQSPIQEEETSGMDLEASYFDIPNHEIFLTFYVKVGMVRLENEGCQAGPGTELHPDKTGFIEWRVDEGEWHNSLTMGGWTALIVM